MQKAVLIPALCHRLPLYSWREALRPAPPPLWTENIANIQNESSINCKEIKQEQSKINSNHQLKAVYTN